MKNAKDLSEHMYCSSLEMMLSTTDSTQGHVTKGYITRHS